MTVCKTVKRRKVSVLKPIILCLCITAGLISIIFSRQISESIVYTAKDTAKTVLPSLFPFMVISSFMAESGLTRYLEIFPGKLLERLSGIKKEVTGAVVLGLASGFPVGSATVCELYKNGIIDKKEAEDALCQAHNTGPAFPISFIGTFLWGSTGFGVCLYLSQIVSMLLLSRILLFNSSVKCKVLNQSASQINYSKALTDSITKSAFSCISVCASIVFWKTVCDLLVKFDPFVNSVITSCFEFSSGAIAAAEIGGFLGATLTGFTVGFGGLAALFQAAGFAADSGLSIKKAFTFKFAQGIVCAVLTLVSFFILK